MISTSVANEKPPSIKSKNVLINPFPCKKITEELSRHGHHIGGYYIWINNRKSLY